LQKKTYENNLRSNNYAVRTSVARCFSDNLDVMVFENVNLSSDKIGRSPLWANETELGIHYQSFIHAANSVQCIFQQHVNFRCTLDLEVFNFGEKMSFILCYELNPVHVNLLLVTSNGDD
jgi:hypothetical protein